MITNQSRKADTPPDAATRLARDTLTFQEALVLLTDAPSPSALFPKAVETKTLPVDAIATMSDFSFQHFRVWPIFLDSGWRGVPGAVYDTAALKKQFPEYLENPRSNAPSAIAETARNVAQHGKIIEQLPLSGQLCFAPGAIFLKEFSYLDQVGRCQKFLVCMVSDEGMGIENPSHSLAPGVGTWFGENHMGMGYELSDSVLMLIRSKEGRWFLFDGLHHDANEVVRLRDGQEGIVGVPPLAELKLPAGHSGCKKIFVFQHPTSDAENVFQAILGLIEPLKR